MAKESNNKVIASGVLMCSTLVLSLALTFAWFSVTRKQNASVPIVVGDNIEYVADSFKILNSEGTFVALSEDDFYQGSYNDGSTNQRVNIYPAAPGQMSFFSLQVKNMSSKPKIISLNVPAYKELMAEPIENSNDYNYYEDDSYFPMKVDKENNTELGRIKISETINFYGYSEAFHVVVDDPDFEGTKYGIDSSKLSLLTQKNAAKDKNNLSIFQTSSLKVNEISTIYFAVEFSDSPETYYSPKIDLENAFYKDAIEGNSNAFASQVFIIDFYTIY